ncbi:MAG TPA: ABC transporter permease [Anaerolineae bacterium]|nr:ABC transporter permease [Anaerolineae bacterium]
MWRFLGQRFLQMVITLFLFQAATYFLIDAQPGDIADLLTLDPNIPPSERQRLRAELGLDRPPVERFFKYIGNFYQGDMGVSFQEYPKKVIDIIEERLPRTLVLFLSANLVSFWVGFVTGKILAWRRGGWVEYASTITGVILYTVFLPWFGLMMIWLFAVTIDLFPAGKFLSPINWLTAPVNANYIFIRMTISTFIALIVIFIGTVLSNRIESRYRFGARLVSFIVPLAGLLYYWQTSEFGALAWDITSHLVLPVLTLTLYAYAGTMLITRTSMLETLREDFIFTARAKGLPEKVVRDKHAARTALLPVWTGLIFSLPAALSGGIITETIFSWPGIGLAYLQAAVVEDIPVVMGILTIIGILTLVSHLIADIGYAFLDPRIRYN